MTAYSQNGWRANDRSLIHTYTVPGTTVRLPIRKGNAATVLLYVADRYNRQVEKLHDGWCWGYAERNIRGSSTTLSNHASGTAIDLNAPAHPRGTRPSANYSAKQIRAIHAIVRDCHGVIRWGGDYVSAPKDGMHFEINTDATHVAALAAKLAASSSPQEAADMDLKDSVTLNPWVKQAFPDDKGLQDGKIQVNTALGSTYGYARRADQTASKMLATVRAQQAAIEKLVDAIAAGPKLDAAALKAEIKAAIEAVVVKLTVP